MLSKLKLNDAGMARCEECGKLFESRGGRPLCRECMQELGEEIIAHANDPESELQAKTERLMALFSNGSSTRRGPSQADGLYFAAKSGMCARCKKREPIPDSDFCLACHLDLDNALGTASRDLLSRVELYEPARPRRAGASVMDVYGDKASEKSKNAVVPPHSQSPRTM